MLHKRTHQSHCFNNHSMLLTKIFLLMLTVYGLSELADAVQKVMYKEYGLFEGLAKSEAHLKGKIHKTKLECVSRCMKIGCPGFAVAGDGKGCVRSVCVSELPEGQWNLHMLPSEYFSIIIAKYRSIYMSKTINRKILCTILVCDMDDLLMIFFMLIMK